MRLLKEEANNRAKKAKQNANARRVAYRPPTKRGLNTIKENNNNNLKSPPINNPLFKPNNVAYPLPRPKPNNSNSNNNYYNTIENFPENVNARATKRAANLLFNEAARKREAAIAKMTAANAARATLERKLANQAAANAKAAEKAAAAASKKTTITCVKGKLAKKVTAVKPVCPKGYKKK
jgi:multidrug efflux pump subunit AcrA (membrane-fusion protein)